MQENLRCLATQSCAVAALLLATTTSGLAAAPAHVGSFFSFTVSNIELTLNDLNPDDNLSPQSTLSQSDLQSFFTGVSGIGSYGGAIEGFLGPYTEAVIDFDYSLTLHAASNPDARVAVLFDDQPDYISNEFLGYFEYVATGGVSGHFFADENNPDVSITDHARKVFRSYDDPLVPSFTRYGIGIYILIADVDDGVPLAAVPEPSTYALMLGGLGLVGMFARRTRTVRKGEVDSPV